MLSSVDLLKKQDLLDVSLHTAFLLNCHIHVLHIDMTNIPKINKKNIVH